MKKLINFLETCVVCAFIGLITYAMGMNDPATHKRDYDAGYAVGRDASDTEAFNAFVGLQANQKKKQSIWQVVEK